MKMILGLLTVAFFAYTFLSDSSNNPRNDDPHPPRQKMCWRCGKMVSPNIFGTYHCCGRKWK